MFDNVILNIIGDISHVLFGIVDIIMKLAPIGTFGAMAFTIGKYGLASLGPLGKLLGIVYLTCIVFVFVVAKIYFIAIVIQVYTDKFETFLYHSRSRLRRQH